MQWKKDANLKYTDLCIFIDENIQKIVNPGENPDLENKIYNYLWLLVKALAIKKCMFKNFQDYDPYAFYSANRLFFALRKNLWNQGKVIKGKEIRPIKSCLNYTKALLYPMKIEYQNEAYREVISEEFVSKKFDSYLYKEQLRSAARVSQGSTTNFKMYLQSSFKNLGSIIDKVLQNSPFAPNTEDFKRLKISLMLNALNSLKNKKRLDSELPTIILWKLPKSMGSYVRILLKEFYTELKLEIMECHKATHIEDAIIDSLLKDVALEGEDNYEN